MYDYTDSCSISMKCVTPHKQVQRQTEVEGERETYRQRWSGGREGDRQTERRERGRQTGGGGRETDRQTDR